MPCLRAQGWMGRGRPSFALYTGAIGSHAPLPIRAFVDPSSSFLGRACRMFNPMLSIPLSFADSLLREAGTGPALFTVHHIPPPPLLCSLVCSILAESWREEADIGRVLWALQQLFHEALLARMPLAHPPAFML